MKDKIMKDKSPLFDTEQTDKIAEFFENASLEDKNNFLDYWVEHRPRENTSFLDIGNSEEHMAKYFKELNKCLECFLMEKAL